MGDFLQWICNVLDTNVFFVQLLMIFEWPRARGSQFENPFDELERGGVSYILNLISFRKRVSNVALFSTGPQIPPGKETIAIVKPFPPKEQSTWHRLQNAL